MRDLIILSVVFLEFYSFADFDPSFVYAQEVKTFRQEQVEKEQEQYQLLQGENKALREDSKEKTPEEKAGVIEAHRRTQFQENRDFNAHMHQENMDFLKSRLAGNAKLTDAEKTELIDFFENQYQEDVSFSEQRHRSC